MRALFAVIFMLIGTQVGAKKILMACDGLTYKYQKSLFGSVNVRYKVEGSE